MIIIALTEIIIALQTNILLIFVGVMAYYPNIPGYAPFYIQTATDANAVDIMTAFGVVVKNHDIPYQRKTKEPYKNDWHDEHGDDEYVGDTIFMEAFTFTEKCVMITKEADSDEARQVLADQIAAFQDYLSHGEFKIFDDYTKRGFQHVRLNEFPAPAQSDYDVFRGKARIIFDVSFKVNDPVTKMGLRDGKITAI